MDDLTADDRRRAILEQLQLRDGSHNVEDLRAIFRVSVATIRRDLERLSREGLITRTYGGALLGSIRAERPLSDREVTNAKAKDAIAREAAALVQPAFTVFLDAGTTTGRLAAHLVEMTGVTVITNGINSLNVLGQSRNDIEVIALGGPLRATNLATSGPIAEATVRGLYADIAFLGADCVDPVLGFASRTLELGSLKALMAAHSRRTVLLADSSKFGGPWSTHWTQFPPGTDIITDGELAPSEIAAFDAVPDVNLVVARELPAHPGARTEPQGPSATRLLDTKRTIS